MIGRTVAHYTIQNKIGQGGMGEVYLATDTRLKRQVALKVLSDSLARDDLQLARLTREAEVLASLDHPNIAQIYGIEELGEGKALVLQYVEGPTLAERIARGPIDLEEALPLAVQITQALEGAHERGIVHRDLKPANVKIAAEGSVKILDFGLAQSLSQDRDDSAIADSPTLTVEATSTGAILGTPGYMSPEQARGHPTDRRADIWSFGCVFYQMLTGAPPFPGDSLHEVVGAVLHQEPDLERLPATAKRRFGRLLRRCFQKDPALRWQHMGDVRIELLDEVQEPLPAPAENRRSSLVFLALALLLGLLLGGVGVWSWTSDSPEAKPITTFAVKAPDWVGSVAISPDGETLAFRSGNRLYTRRLGELTLRPVSSSEGEISVLFFSPDSRWLGFASGDFLYRIAVDGGDPYGSPRLATCRERPGARKIRSSFPTAGPAACGRCPPTAAK